MRLKIWLVFFLFCNLSFAANDVLSPHPCLNEVLDKYGLGEIYRFTVPEDSEPSRRLVEETSLFLSDLHRDLHGQPPLFREIRFRPGSFFSRRRLGWMGGEVLTIYLPPSRRAQANFNAEELRRHWNQGKQFASGLRLKLPLIEKRWDLLNPVGELRLSLRRSLERIAIKIGGEVGALLHAGVPGDRRETLIRGLRNFAEQHGIETAKLSEFSKAKWDRLDEATERELEAILLKMMAFVEQPVHLTEMSDAVIADMQAFPDDYDHQVTEIAVGLVAVTNDHHILVGLSAGSRRYGKYLSSQPQRRRRYFGLALGVIAGVATSDLVSVRVDFRDALHTAALDAAL